MATVLHKVNNVSSIIQIFGCEFGLRENCLVLVKLHAIEVFSETGKEPLARLEMLETLTGGVLWGESKLIVATESSKLVVLSLEHAKLEVVQEIEVKLLERSFSIIGESLRVQNDVSLKSLWITSYEGLVFELGCEKEQFKIKKSELISDIIGHLHVRPLAFDNDTNIESVSSYNILHRDEAHKFYVSQLQSGKGKKFTNFSTIDLTESNIAPVLVSGDTEDVLACFNNNSMIMVPYGQGKSIDLSGSLENNNCELINDSYVRKRLPKNKKWNITAGVRIQDGKIMVLDYNGDLYMTQYTKEVNSQGDLTITSWNIDKLLNHTNLKDVHQLRILEDDKIATLSKSADSILFRVENKQIQIMNQYQSGYPILDLNISGIKELPKLQVCGGGLNQGSIKSEFKGYETKLNLLLPVKDLKVLNIWEIKNYLVLNLISGLKVIDLDGFSGTDSLDEFFNEINGNILDVYLNAKDEIIVISDFGVYNSFEMVETKTINLGKTVDNVSYTITSNYLDFGENHIKLDSEASCLDVFQNHIILGNWNGSICLILNKKSKILKEKGLAINSVKIKKLTSKKIIYLCGDCEGNVIILDSENLIRTLKIGDSPVSIVSLKNSDEFIGYNNENVILFKMDVHGEIIEMGYLRLRADDIFGLEYDNRLLVFKGDEISELTIDKNLQNLSNEMKLHSLVKKSIKFKNYLNLNLFITIEEALIDKKLTTLSKIMTIDNNTFEVKDSVSLAPGIEITDAINTSYHKKLIDINYEEGKISVGFENILSQCFIVSCISQNNDDKISPLILFSVDEDGKIQEQFKLNQEENGKNSSINFYSLNNFGNRIIIANGDFLVGYQIEYLVADSKFQLKRITETYKSNNFVVGLNSINLNSVIIGDIFTGLIKLDLKFNKERQLFEFLRDNKVNAEFQFINLLRCFKVYKNFIILVDSLNNVIIYEYLKENNEFNFKIKSRFNIQDEINIIKTFRKGFLLGSITGGIYLIDLNLDNKFKRSVERLFKHKSDLEKYLDFRSVIKLNNQVKDPCHEIVDGQDANITVDILGFNSN